MTHDPHPWAAQSDTLLDQIWARLVRGVGDRHAPARHPTLATVTPQGMPQARTVVLRGADRGAGVLEVHTDLQSGKVADLRANPLAALHVWDAGAHLQTRIEARADILTGDVVAAVWARVPDPSRQSYGSQPAPGTPIDDPLAYAKRPDAACFVVLRLTVLAIDAVHLGPQHRRARYTRETGWQGQWLAP
ncbi:MAG: pyridoxamine 5'-phosphate oxidase family protein [Paracoccus hibiscisoli]|uniref:pyridoxamine 5'-phosphate oxidase family protein n=1 Tax=Paracoccus hibiscisoli TaxID=2023261 RepID=UPI00391C0453